MTLTVINGEKFNLPALLRMAERAKRHTWLGSDRNIIDVFARLVIAVMAERGQSGKRGEHEKD